MPPVPLRAASSAPRVAASDFTNFCPHACAGGGFRLPFIYPSAAVASDFIFICPHAAVASDFTFNCPYACAVPRAVASDFTFFCPHAAVASDFIFNCPHAAVASDFIFICPHAAAASDFIFICPHAAAASDFIFNCPHAAAASDFIFICPHAAAASDFIFNCPHAYAVPLRAAPRAAAPDLISFCLHLSTVYNTSRRRSHARHPPWRPGKRVKPHSRLIDGNSTAAELGVPAELRKAHARRQSDSMVEPYTRRDLETALCATRRLGLA
ncbi:hypothetical protein TSOC_012624 [Tetrabaena socialis]|uniref:Uncharacterized protein n=1 Tax=Tetrabaena socialis TaxID=47790 RepID=A0A2J7ZMJ1_9CHLO|nr:hypothetical protein TSOC_012624 [Tetrabaena socialis]|eukprot:PNH01486.1 hypothetical protein TSOC_012624 [Tetrabaena socialis]